MRDLAAQEGLGAGRRRNAPAACCRGGGSPATVDLGLPGVDSSGDWVGTHLGDMRDPLMALARHGMARGGARIGGGGWAWRNIAGEWRSKHWSGLRSKTTGAQEKGDPGGAHRA